MEKIETNVINSFSLVKKDIVKLQENYMGLKLSYARLLGKFEILESRKVVKPSVKIVRVKESKKPTFVRKSVRKTYVASKEGKKFHDPGCVSLNKVSSNKLILYASKKKAMSKGLKPCGTCIPR